MYVIQWKGRPYHCVGTNITRILYHAARSVSTASCWFSLLVEDTALPISKTDAYFSITSARKAANALHSSSVGVEHCEEVGLFSVRWQLFNRQCRRIYICFFCVAKILVGNTQTLELHPLDAGLASLNENVYGSNTLSAIGKQLFPAKKENSDELRWTMRKNVIQ